MNNIDDFIVVCESYLINDPDEVEVALEGLNIDTAKLIHRDEIKQARRLLKEARKHERKHQFKEAIDKLNEAIKLAKEVKAMVDKMEEPTGFSKFKSYFTPLFTMLPASKLKSVTPGVTYSGGSGAGVMLTFNYEEAPDSMSENTFSAVKRGIQLRLNLFIVNCATEIKACQKALQYK